MRKGTLKDYIDNLLGLRQNTNTRFGNGILTTLSVRKSRETRYIELLIEFYNWCESVGIFDPANPPLPPLSNPNGHAQPQQAPAQDDDVTKEKPDTCGPETPLPNGVQGTAPTLGTYDAIDLPLSQNPNETPGKTLLSTAILAKLTGNDVGDAVKNLSLIHI